MAASSFSLTSFISFISPFKSQTKPAPPPNLTLPSPTSSHRRINDLAIKSMAVEESSSIASSLSSELASVIFPSLAYSNTLFFSSGYSVQVFVEDNESEEKLVNRFENKQDENTSSVDNSLPTSIPAELLDPLGPISYLADTSPTGPIVVPSHEPSSQSIMRFLHLSVLPPDSTSPYPAVISSNTNPVSASPELATASVSQSPSPSKLSFVFS